MSELTTIEKRNLFITKWEQSGSAQEAADALEMKDGKDENGKVKKGSAAGRASAKASQLRAAGIELKQFPKGQGFPAINISDANTLLAELRGVTVADVEESSKAATELRAKNKTEREVKQAAKAAAEKLAAENADSPSE